MTTAGDESQHICEQHLRDTIQYNTERKIAPSESAVARRMLARGTELRRFYSEVHPRLNHDGITWKHAIGCALYVGWFWKAEDIAECRAGRKALREINDTIASKAAELANLLDRRTELYEKSGFGAETHYAIYDVIDEASAHNEHYQGWVRKPLQNLGSRFDLKYWPSLSECIRVLGEDAGRSKIVPDNAVTGVATQSTRPSSADSLRALLAHIEDLRGDHLGAIPRDFEFSNAALADLLNVLLDLSTEDLVDEAYVKTQRHRFNQQLAATG